LLLWTWSGHPLPSAKATVRTNRLLAVQGMPAVGLRHIRSETAKGLSRVPSATAWPTTASVPSTLRPTHPGRTAKSSPSTAASVTSTSTAINSTHSPKLASLSPTVDLPIQRGVAPRRHRLPDSQRDRYAASGLRPPARVLDTQTL